MIKHYRIEWSNDWDGCLTRRIDLRLLEVSIAPALGVVFCLVVLGVGVTVYRLPADGGAA